MAEYYERWMCLHCLHKHDIEQPHYCEDCGSGELVLVNPDETGFWFSNNGARQVVWKRFAEIPVVSPRYVKVPLLWRLGLYRKVS